MGPLSQGVLAGERRRSWKCHLVLCPPEWWSLVTCSCRYAYAYSFRVQPRLLTSISVSAKVTQIPTAV